MFRKYLTAFLIFALAHYFVGCSGGYHETKVTRDEMKSVSEDSSTMEYIGSIILIDGQEIVLKAHSVNYVAESHQFQALALKPGLRQMGEPMSYYNDRPVSDYAPFSITSDSILYARSVSYGSQNSAGKTVLSVLGITLGLALLLLIIALASKSSCPFIYSYDGDHYVFDAEPLGGAICQGLERTDYSRLRSLHEVEGEYRLMMTNEVPETQHVDELKVVYFDHDSASEVVVDPLGKFHLLQPPQTPVNATDASGRDILPFVTHDDGVAWLSQMPKDSSEHLSARDSLTFTFANPTHARHARLVVNMGTAMWGSKMIKEMLMLRGDSVKNWYQSVNAHGSEYRKLWDFNSREEAYFLKVQVRDGNQWVPRAIIPASGPFITDQRTISLDLSGTTGDSVQIRIAPPRGFWQIDYFGMSFGPESLLPAPHELPLKVTATNSKANVEKQLSESDSNSYDMPNIGDRVELTCPAPPIKQGLKRSIFAKTRGFYDLHLPEGQPENREMIDLLTTKPGAIADYSAKRYFEWISSQAMNKRK